MYIEEDLKKNTYGELMGDTRKGKVQQKLAKIPMKYMSDQDELASKIKKLTQIYGDNALLTS